MTQVRVIDLARELDLQVVDVMRELRRLGVNTTSAEDNVASEVAAIVEQWCRQIVTPSPVWSHEEAPDTTRDAIANLSGAAIDIQGALQAILAELRAMHSTLAEISEKLNDIASSVDIDYLENTAADVRYELQKANDRNRR